MTCTNQEDVSAVQFHFAWHESHAQGFHLRPISVWKRARVLRFLSQKDISATQQKVKFWHPITSMVKMVCAGLKVTPQTMHRVH